LQLSKPSPSIEEAADEHDYSSYPML